MDNIKKVFLSAKGASAAFGGHPWVFSKMISNIEGSPQDGDIVSVFAKEQKIFIAYGLFNSNSDIQVRLYSWYQNEPLTQEWFRNRIEEAVHFRSQVLNLHQPNGARRLIFSESDQLSGLTVDQFGPFLVVQVTSLALAKRVELITSILVDICKPKGILWKSVPNMDSKEGLVSSDQVLFGDVSQQTIQIEENGVKFEIDLRTGQKTGFYLDQRENRSIIQTLARDRTVLDLYCYSGGFSLNCAKGGASKVVGVDVSSSAISLAQRNAELNEMTNIKFNKEDALQFLSLIPKESFSMIILDPPRFVSSKKSKQNALKMYYRINFEALKILERGGLFVTCSCSGRSSIQEFLSLLASVARRSKKLLQILELRGASKDHPYSLHCPESQYLKCVVAKVT